MTDSGYTMPRQARPQFDSNAIDRPQAAHRHVAFEVADNRPRAAKSIWGGAPKKQIHGHKRTAPPELHSKKDHFELKWYGRSEGVTLASEASHKKIEHELEEGHENKRREAHVPVRFGDGSRLAARNGGVKPKIIRRKVAETGMLHVTVGGCSYRERYYLSKDKAKSNMVYTEPHLYEPKNMQNKNSYERMEVTYQQSNKEELATMNTLKKKLFQNLQRKFVTENDLENEIGILQAEIDSLGEDAGVKIPNNNKKKKKSASQKEQDRKMIERAKLEDAKGLIIEAASVADVSDISESVLQEEDQEIEKSKRSIRHMEHTITELKALIRAKEENPVLPPEKQSNVVPISKTVPTVAPPTVKKDDGLTIGAGGKTMKVPASIAGSRTGNYRV